jgi:hypothetical protein
MWMSESRPIPIICKDSRYFTMLLLTAICKRNKSNNKDMNVAIKYNFGVAFSQ